MSNYQYCLNDNGTLYIYVVRNNQTYLHATISDCAKMSDKKLEKLCLEILDKGVNE